jgi:hypothetical protein
MQALHVFEVGNIKNLNDFSDMEFITNCCFTEHSFTMEFYINLLYFWYNYPTIFKEMHVIE